MMTRNFSMRKYSKQIFVVFYVYLVSSLHYSVKTAVFYINICCFIIAVLSAQDWYHSITQPRKTLLDERISEVSYTCCLFCVKFCCHGDRGWSWRNLSWLTAFNSPIPKTPYCVQESKRYLPQKPSYCLFCFKFSLPWQQGLVVVEFVWRRSIARPPKLPTRRKHLVDISHTS